MTEDGISLDLGMTVQFVDRSKHLPRGYLSQDKIHNGLDGAAPSEDDAGFPRSHARRRHQPDGLLPTNGHVRGHVDRRAEPGRRRVTLATEFARRQTHLCESRQWGLARPRIRDALVLQVGQPRRKDALLDTANQCSRDPEMTGHS